MTKIEFFSVLGYFLLFGLSSLGLGITIINFFRNLFAKKDNMAPTLQITGAAFMIGLGAIGYLGLILGLLGFFYKSIIIIFCAIIIFATFKQWSKYLAVLYKNIKKFFVFLYQNPIALLSFVLGLWLAISLYLTAMNPPTAWDAVAYHMPEAQSIVTTHHLSLQIEDHYFYGNIPKLMEIIFAIGIAVSGFSLAQSLSLSFLFAFALIIIGIIGKNYNYKTGILAGTLVFLYPELQWNLTSGYIDGATVCLEIGALLFAIDWLTNKTKISLVLSGVTLGLALGIKYSPIPTILYILFLILIFGLKEKNLKRYLSSTHLFGLLIFIFSCYWYVKNLILHGNPFFPLYFGHKGVSEAEYTSLLNAIQQFGPKTLKNFLSTPYKYSTSPEYPVFISFYLAPLAIFIKKKWAFHGLLLMYCFLFLIYWFFFATHQLRFLMPMIVTLLILMGIVVSLFIQKMTSKIRYINLKKAVELLLIIFIITGSVAFFGNRNKKVINIGFYHTIYRKVLFIGDHRYALGRITKDQFLGNAYGCRYSTINFLNNERISGKIMDNWSIWHEVTLSIYLKNNEFVTFKSSDSNTFRDIESENITMIFINSRVKKQSQELTTDPVQQDYYAGRLESEDKILKKSSVIFTEDACTLYRINP